jgi:hypothetical protein
MKNRRELFVEWDFPHIQRNGVTLVAKNDWVDCVKKILAEGCQYYGHDAFSLFENGSIQPSMEWSGSWPESKVPTFDGIFNQLAGITPDITHIEFVFSKVD